MTEPDLDQPHACHEGVWIVPCDERCPLRDAMEEAA